MKKKKFILGEKVLEEEDYRLEFKEIKGSNPIDAIKNTCDEYVVAFLNYKGGKIIWGISDSKEIKGVKLPDSKLRDDLQKAIDNKLNQIQPPISPSAYKVSFHKIFHNKQEVDGLYIIEIQIKSRTNKNYTYATASNEVFIKTKSGKTKLKHEQLVDEIKRRSNLVSKVNTEKNNIEKPLINTNKFVVNFDEYGSPLHEDKELWAIGAEAFLFAKSNQSFSFEVNMQKIETLQKELLFYSNRDLTFDERISKVYILDELERQKKYQGNIKRALELLFLKEVRYFVNDPYEIGLAIKGIGSKAVRNFRNLTLDQGLDVWRKDYKNIGTVIWVPRKDIDSSNRMVIWGGEGDVYDLGQKNMMEIAVPAILLEVVRVEENKSKIDLHKLLNLSEWSIGPH